MSREIKLSQFGTLPVVVFRNLSQGGQIHAFVCEDGKTARDEIEQIQSAKHLEFMYSGDAVFKGADDDDRAQRTNVASLPAKSRGDAGGGDASVPARDATGCRP